MNVALFQNDREVKNEKKNEMCAQPINTISGFLSFTSVVLGKIERTCNYQISRDFKIFRHKLQEYGHGVMFSRRFDSGISLLKARIFSKGSKFFPQGKSRSYREEHKENGRIAFPENVSIYHKLFIQRFVKIQ